MTHLYSSLKQLIYHIMEEPVKGDRVARCFNFCIVSLILINVVVVILETVPFLNTMFFWEFMVIDIISFGVFSIEYVLRLWVCTSNPAFRGIISGRVRYALTMPALIDLLAIAPFYLPLLMPVDLRMLRLLRLFRLFRIVRILKLGRYSAAVRTFYHVIAEKKEQLLLTLSALLIAIVVASSLMFYAEHEAQPESFSSIPHTMWWALETLATAGYGDMYPITPLGKVIGGVVVLVGIAIFALPTAILASGFIENADAASAERKNKGKTITCPVCGHHIIPQEPGLDDPDHDDTGSG
jgi:voltage-gated potassium channel